MHHTHLEALQVVQKLSYRLAEGGGVGAGTDVSVHPAFTALRSVQTIIETDDIPISLGAQDCYQGPAEQGAFTGEVSCLMLAKLNVSYVIVGHSERRQLFGETDDIVAAKVKAVVGASMTPVMCVGETAEERASGAGPARVTSQVAAGLAGLAALGRAAAASAIAAMVIAYEPIWAIGTGNTAGAAEAQEMCALVRQAVAAVAGDGAAAGVRVQYGGSVKAANAGEIMAGRDVDGLLVGGASLSPDEFAEVVRRSVLKR